MDIQRRYLDEPEHSWTTLTEAQATSRLQPFFLDATPQVLTDLAHGQTIYTDVAEYRLAKPTTK